MAVTLTTGAQNAACNGIVDLIDIGAGSNGTIEIYTTGLGLLLVTCDFSATSFGAAASGVATANSIADGTAIASGTANEFLVKDKDGNEVFRGSVDTSGADMTFADNIFSIGDTITITSFTATMPAT